jgi:hypothetical protein
MLDDIIQDCDCGGSFTFSLSDVANGRTVRCTNGCSIELRDANGSAAEVDRSVRDFERALDGLGRNIKF